MSNKEFNANSARIFQPGSLKYSRTRTTTGVSENENKNKNEIKKKLETIKYNFDEFKKKNNINNNYNKIALNLDKFDHNGNVIIKKEIKLLNNNNIAKEYQNLLDLEVNFSKHVQDINEKINLFDNYINKLQDFNTEINNLKDSIKYKLTSNSLSEKSFARNIIMQCSNLEQEIDNEIDKYNNLIIDYKNMEDNFIETWKKRKNDYKKELFEALMKKYSNMIKVNVNLQTLPTNNIEKIKKLNEYKNILTNIQSKLINLEKTINNNLKNILKNNQEIKSFVNKDLERFKESITFLLTKVDETIQNTKNNINTKIKNLENNIDKEIKDLLDKLKDCIKNCLEQVNNKEIKEKLEKLDKFIGFTEIKINNIKSSTNEKLQKMNNVKQGINNIISKMIINSNTPKNIKSGINNNINTIMSEVAKKTTVNNRNKEFKKITSKINGSPGEKVMWYSPKQNEFKYGVLNEKQTNGKWKIKNAKYFNNVKISTSVSPLSPNILRKYNKNIKESLKKKIEMKKLIF